jgi:hypothetical protein
MGNFNKSSLNYPANSIKKKHTFLLIELIELIELINFPITSPLPLATCLLQLALSHRLMP